VVPRGRTDLEGRLGHRFRDAGLLGLALTPPSSGSPVNNQRLEFLGDALLNAAVALLALREKPDWAEGDLSKLRASLVRRETLVDWARDIDLRLTHAPLPPGKQPPAGREKPLSDALEAVLAAIFLDVQGGGGDGFTAVLAVVERRFLAPIRAADAEAWKTADPKTALKERTEALGLDAPRFHRLAQRGPDHAPRFRVRAEAGGHSTEAEAGTIKGAEADAARLLLARLLEGR
jgi:ribonuclease-3